MTGNLTWLSALCAPEAALRGSLLVGLFVAGTAGSVVHCAPMCGGFVLGQVCERMTRLTPEKLSESQRIGNSLLLPYHSGRLTTYAMLGATAATAAGWFAQPVWLTALSVTLLLLAAGFFLMLALRRLTPSRLTPIPTWLDHAPRWWAHWIGRLVKRIPRGSGLGEYLLGLALGFLPCGFLYAALAAAAASERPIAGATAMVAFGLGTVPALVVVGFAGHAAGRRWHRGVAAAAPVLMVLNALLLLALAWRRVT